MERAIQRWLEYLDESNGEQIVIPGKLRLPYTIYGSMLLLSHTAFESAAWRDILARCIEVDLLCLYKLLAKHLKITHIAINRPIPAHNNSDDTDNILRAPSNFTPLYGNFGPTACNSPPTSTDFDAAYWVNAKQNGILQTWAPRWTMFSRGNISEKARLLTLPSVERAVEQGKFDGRGCAAVDLYAGIGYFAFSYVKAGVDTVLCWDVNPWSIEGLKRGAAANKWTFVDCEGECDSIELTTDKPSFFLFQESNAHALQRVRAMRAQLPPIRHVNCGLLPSSKDSLKIALEVLDPGYGGWVHHHENFAVEEIEMKAEEVRSTFEKMDHGKRQAPIELESIHRVKSYAPGVMHCVLDIHVPPAKPGCA